MNIGNNPHLKLSQERFAVVYKLHGERQEAEAKAHDICFEQTVEFPPDLVPDGVIRNEVVGKVETFTTLTPAVHLAKISYAIETAGNELTQLFNVIFGNISIKPGIRVEKIEPSPAFADLFPGPRFGIAGLRRRLVVEGRPLLCTALKPLGLSAMELANLAYEFAAGGIDIIKDDHGLANQTFCLFTERVMRVTEAIRQANQDSGHHSIYAANVSGPFTDVVTRALFAKQNGAGALLISPGLTGYDVCRHLSGLAELDLPLIFHPAFHGTYVVSPQHGISHYALYGQIARLCGADASIYPNFGGRFSFTQEECREIVQGCRDTFGNYRKIFPTPGGGMSFHDIPALRLFYGNDVIFLMGGGLFRGGDSLRANCRKWRAMMSASPPATT